MKTTTVLIVLFIIVVALLMGFPLFLSDKTRPGLVIRGSTTVYPFIYHCVDHFMEQHPEAHIVLSAGGSGSGIAALLDDQADIAMSSRPLRPEEEALIIDKKFAIDHYVLGQDGIAIIVHPKNPIVDIALTELHGIYSGTITKWHEIGGSQQMVVPISRDVTSGTYIVFSDYVLESKDVATAVQLVPSNEAMVYAVAHDERAIGYIGLSYLSDEVKAVAINGISPEPSMIANGEYPLSRQLFLFTRKESYELKDAFLSFVLGSEGQQIIKDDHLISIQ